MNVLIGHVKMVESVSIPEEAMSALAQKLIRESIASEVTAQLLTLNNKLYIPNMQPYQDPLLC